MAFNFNVNPYIFAFLTEVIVTLIFFDRFGLPAAGTYLLLSFTTLFLLFFAFFLFKEEDYVSDLLPYNRNFDRGILVFILGILLPLSLFIVGASLSKLNITEINFYNPAIMAPLASGSTLEPTSFQAWRLKASPTTQWFSETQGAPILEEILLSFGFVIISAFITLLFIIIFLSLTTHQSSSQLFKKAIKYKKTLLFGGIIGSVLIFTGVHIFNGTYNENPSLFLFAAIFRLIINLVTFTYIKLGIEFGIAVHGINNTLAFIFNPITGVGISGFLSAITTPVALLLILFTYIIPLLILIIRWDYIKPMLKEILKAMAFMGKTGFKD